MSKITKKRDRKGLAAAVTAGALSSVVKRVGSRYVTKRKFKFTKKDGLAIGAAAAIAWIGYKLSDHSRD